MSPPAPSPIPSRRCALLCVGIPCQADTVWGIFFFGDESENIVYCASVEDSATVHPADATWQCKDPKDVLLGVSSSRLTRKRGQSYANGTSCTGNQESHGVYLDSRHNKPIKEREMRCRMRSGATQETTRFSKLNILPFLPAASKRLWWTGSSPCLYRSLQARMVGVV